MTQRTDNEPSLSAEPASSSSALHLPRILAGKSAGWIVIAVWVARVLTGAAFIFSGFTKGVDPWGTIFKIEQYLAVFDMNQPRMLILGGAILLSAFEFVIGIVLLTGCFRRSAPWFVLPVMIFFTLLTFYLALASPVDDCGCFGDALHLSNWATFWKNLILLGLVIFLLFYNRRVMGLYMPSFQWLVMIFSLFFVCTLSIYGYMVQPAVDFRSFPVGRDLLAENDDNIVLIYEKDGRKQGFDIDNLPSEEDGWSFVERSETGSAPMQLIIEDSNGDDVREETIPSDSDMILVVVPEVDRADLASTMYLNRIHSVAKKEGIVMAAIVGTTDNKELENWQRRALSDYPTFRGESTQLKELSRGEVSIVYLKKGRIQNKYSLSVISNARITELEEGTVKTDNLFSFDIDSALRYLTATFVLLLFILVVVSFAIRLYPRRH